MGHPSSPPPSQPAAPPPLVEGAEERRAQLQAYFGRHQSGYKREFLSRAATDAGYDGAEIAAAWAAVDRDAEPVDRSVRTRAAWLVAALYVGTFLLLTVPTSMRDDSYGIGPPILAIVLGIVGVASFIRIMRGRSVPEPTLAGLTSLVAVPVLLLLVIAGTCVYAVPPRLAGG